MKSKRMLRKTLKRMEAFSDMAKKWKVKERRTTVGIQGGKPTIVREKVEVPYTPRKPKKPRKKPPRARRGKSSRKPKKKGPPNVLKKIKKRLRR